MPYLPVQPNQLVPYGQQLAPIIGGQGGFNWQQLGGAPMALGPARSTASQAINIGDITHGASSAGVSSAQGLPLGGIGQNALPPGGVGGALAPIEQGAAAGAQGVGGAFQGAASAAPVASGALGGVEGAVAGAAGSGGVGGFLSQFGPAAFNISKGSVMGGGAVAAGGALAGHLLDNLDIGGHNSTADQLIPNAVIGAGVGGGAAIALGLGAGPVGWAALAGAGALALGQWAFGDHRTNSQKVADEAQKQDDKLQAVIQTAGLSSESRQQINLQLAVAQQYAQSPADLKAMYQQAAQAIPALAAQEDQQRRQLTGLLATQQAMAPGFDSYLKGLGADSRAFQSATNGMAQQMTNPTQAAYMKQLGAQSVMSDDATAAAYKAQSQLGVAQQAAAINAPSSMYQQLLQQYG